jgi:hypothetical protein
VNWRAHAPSAPHLLAVAALSLAASHAIAEEVDPESRFTIGRLKYGGGGDWYANPTSLPNLLAGLSERTNVAVTEREVAVRLTDETLYRTPFLYMTGHGAVKFTEEEIDRLREFLTSGGFLWADDNYGMNDHFRAQMARVFPEGQLVELPFDHPIYHVLYDFEKGPPKIHEHDGKPAQGLALFHEGRMVVFYTYESDIGDGLEDPDVHNDPPDRREAAMRMATNVVLYSLLY